VRGKFSKTVRNRTKIMVMPGYARYSREAPLENMISRDIYYVCATRRRCAPQVTQWSGARFYFLITSSNETQRAAHACYFNFYIPKWEPTLAYLAK